jgi:tRNA modification GTPase
MGTIAAISTATGKGGIGIIRMSGDNCFEILEKIFQPKNKGEIKGYSIKYGNIINSETNEIIDEVLVSYFIKPRSYTTENMCEINSHGGIIVEKAILEQCLKNGATLAEPGEFTKRAFINGRIDLSQAEAVIDIINSKTEVERKASVNQLEGRLSRKIGEIQAELLDAMADIEASIDYPEYDIEETTNDKLKKILSSVESKLKLLRDSYKNGKIMKEGIKTIIVGKPNVGKSSLLNLMLNEERAIVSDIEGTTRDTIEEFINIDGIPLKIIDTAGIRKTNDEVEKIGVKKSIKVINDADLIIALFDDSRAFEDEDKEILELIKNKQAIILLNKVDLGKNNIDDNKVFGEKKVIKFSTLTEKGLDELYKTISEMFSLNEIEVNDGKLITNMRQKQHIDNAIIALNEAYSTLDEGMPIDISAISIKEILEELGEITGQNVSEDIINEIFSKFCLGK